MGRVPYTRVACVVEHLLTTQKIAVWISVSPLTGNSLRQAAHTRMCLCHQAV